MKKLSRFLFDQAGGIAVMAAITAVPVTLAAGAAIDMVRANHVQTVLQSAVDSAAIGGATSKKSKKVDYEVIVNDYLKENGAEDVLKSISKIDSNLNSKTGTFTVSIEGKVETSFMRLAGIKNFDVGVSATISMGTMPLEVALVLDNTTSMEGTRITALKSAAHVLVDDLMAKKASGSDVKVGLVPFSEYVNVGLSSRSEPWMSVPAETSETKERCHDTYPDRVEFNCRMVSGVDYRDGVSVPYTRRECDENLGTPLKVCKVETWSDEWRGCVGSRNSPLDAAIGTMTTPYPGLLNDYCATPLTEMTDNATKIGKAIDAMVTTGNTYIPAGLLWGWNLLDEAAPFGNAYSKAKMASLSGRKALVLMTDGMNTLSADYPRHWGNDKIVANKLTKQLCDSIKDDGIVIYTIAFEVTDSTSLAMLQDCASSSENAFVADDSAALMASFASIADGLTDIRLVK